MVPPPSLVFFLWPDRNYGSILYVVPFLWHRNVVLVSLVGWSCERLSEITFSLLAKYWKYMEESAEMKRVANFSAMAA